MKKISMLLSALFLTLILCGTIYANPKKGYEVVNKTAHSFTIKDKKDSEVTLTIASNTFNAEDKVRCDEKKKI